MTDDQLIDAVWDNINDEINEFRLNVTLWDAQERAQNKEKIDFYEEMTKYLADANLFMDEYKELFQHGKSVLHDLWNFSLKKGYSACDVGLVYEYYLLTGEISM